MRVISIVGPSGSGKTTLVDYLHKKYDIPFIEENYINSKSDKFSNKDVISKWNWISDWFDRIVLACSKHDLVITDRCPLESIPYAEKGFLLKDALIESFTELKKYNIHVYTIYLSVPFDQCIQRIIKRISHEPIRAKYNELDVDFQRSVYSFYENDKYNLWDHKINCNSMSTNEIAVSFMHIYCELKTQSILDENK